MAKPLQTVGSLVEHYRSAGKTEEQIAKEFESFYGAPHWNLPAETPLRQARLQSPREIRKRGAAPGTYEEIFVPPEQRVKGAVEQLVQEPEAPPPETPGPEETVDAGEAAQYQQAEAEIAEAVKNSMSATEIRGGMTDPLESAKRTWGALKGIGEKVLEMTPFAEEGPPPEYGTDIGVDETQKQYVERKQRETQARQEFEKVQKDPNHGILDLLRATPAWKNFQAGQEERVTRADKPGLTGLAGRLGNAVEDIGDLVMFLPRLGYAPISSFEVPKEMTSEEYGKKVGRELPGAIGTAMVAPYIDPAQSFKVAPMSTIFAWLPGLQALGKGMKAMPGIKKLPFTKLQTMNSAVTNALPKAFSTVVDGIAKKLGGGITTQALMDRFYSGDPGVTALLEEAFGQDANVKRAVEELGDALAVRKTGVLYEAIDTGVVSPGTRRAVDSVLNDIATSLKRLNYTKPDGTPFKNLGEIRAHLNSLIDVELSSSTVQYMLRTPKELMLALNGDKNAYRVLQQLMKEDPALSWEKLGVRLKEMGMGPGDPIYNRLESATNTLKNMPLNVDASRVRQMMGKVLRDEANMASERNASKVLGEEAGRYSPPRTDRGPIDPNSQRVHDTLLEVDTTHAPERDVSFDINKEPLKTLTPSELTQQANNLKDTARANKAVAELMSRSPDTFTYQEALDEMSRLRNENLELQTEIKNIQLRANEALNSNIDSSSLQAFLDQSDANTLTLQTQMEKNAQRLKEFEIDISARKNVVSKHLQKQDIATPEATAQSVLSEFQRTKQYPQTINSKDLGALITELKALGTNDALKMAEHIEQMKELKTPTTWTKKLQERIDVLVDKKAKGIITDAESAQLDSLENELHAAKTQHPTHGTSYVTWLQDQHNADSAMSEGISKVFKEVNALVKANVLPANWKSVVSNLVGNSVAVAAKLGWTAHPWEELGRVWTNLKAYDAFKKGTMLPTDPNFRSMRALSRSGIINTDAFNADLMKYASAFDPKLIEGMPGKVVQGVTAVAGAPAKMGGAAMVGADQGAKARVFTAKFDELSSLADKLKEGEFIQYPSGPNTITRLESIPDPVDPRVTNRFRETTYVRDAGKKGGLRQVGKAKEYLRDGSEGGLQFDDAIAQGAGKFATDFIFDYDRVPGLVLWQRRAPLVGAASPFSTFAFKALEIPGVKRGLPSAIMSATDGVVSNSSSVNVALAKKAAAQWIKQNYIAAGGRATAQDEDKKRMMSFDPSRPDAVQVVGPATGSQLADVTTFTSANWAEGLQTVLQTLSSAAQQLADDKGTPSYDKFVKMTNEKLVRAQAGKEDTAQQMEARKNAYLLTLGELQNKALTPEMTPQIMKLAGLGGTVFFDTYANWRDSGKTGKVSPGLDSLAKMLIPGAYRSAIEAYLAENDPTSSLVAGKMARGLPKEGTDPGAFSKDERVGIRMLLENLTGLQAVRIDTVGQADRMKKSMQKELEGKLEKWSKEREAAIKLQLGDREGTREAMREKEILKEMIHETVTNWYERQLRKGNIGRQR